MTPSDREHSEDEPARPDNPGPAMSEEQAWELIVANYGERVLPSTSERDAHPAGRGRAQPEDEPRPEAPGGPTSAADSEADTPPQGVREGDQEGGDPSSAQPPDLGAVVVPDTEAHPDRDPVSEREERIARSEGFVPPPLPPLPRASWPRMAAWAGALGVPLVLLVTMFVGLTLPRILLGVAMGWFVAGFMFLVATMSREPRDPWDDGSRV